MAHNYEIGTRAWQPESTEGWVASELIAKTETPTGFDLVFKLENGEVNISSLCRAPDMATLLTFLRTRKEL